MSGYIPAYPWANGRASGLSFTAARFLDELDSMGDYVEGFVGGGLSIESPGTVTTDQTLNMSDKQECLWVATLGASGLKFNIIGMAAGDSVTLVLKQDGVGGRGLAPSGLPAAKWDDGALPTSSLAAGAIDIRGFFSDGVDVYGFDSGTGMASV